MFTVIGNIESFIDLWDANLHRGALIGNGMAFNELFWSAYNKCGNSQKNRFVTFPRVLSRKLHRVRSSAEEREREGDRWSHGNCVIRWTGKWWSHNFYCGQMSKMVCGLVGEWKSGSPTPLVNQYLHCQSADTRTQRVCDIRVSCCCCRVVLPTWEYNFGVHVIFLLYLILCKYWQSRDAEAGSVGKAKRYNIQHTTTVSQSAVFEQEFHLWFISCYLLASHWTTLYGTQSVAFEFIDDTAIGLGCSPKEEGRRVACRRR